MSRKSVQFLGVALALLLVVAARAHAGPDYQYNATPGQTYVYSNNALDLASRVKFSNENEVHRDDDSNITATILTTESGQPVSTKAHFTGRIFSVQVALREGTNMVNPNSLPTGTLTFHGHIDDAPGTPSKVGLWNNGSRLTYTLIDPVQEITVGNLHFKVSFDGFTHLINGPDTGLKTSIDGVVEVHELPEPSTAILSCVGLSFLGVYGFRRWKIAR